MISGARRKATAVTWAGRENFETIAKQKQLLSANLDVGSMRGLGVGSQNYIYSAKYI